MGALDWINRKLDAGEKKYGEISTKAKKKYETTKAGYEKAAKTAGRFGGYASKTLDLIPDGTPRKKKKVSKATTPKRTVTKPKTKTVLASCKCKAVPKKK